MRILYGINGTGNGHLTKSLRVVGALESRGHSVDTLVSGMNGNVPAGRRIDHKLKGFTFAYRSGSIDMVRTLMRSDLVRFIRDIGIDLSSYDRVITDFEPVTAWACKVAGRECTGISHQAAFLCGATPRPRRRSLMQEAFMRLFAPVTRHAGIHFNRYCSSVYPPILRHIPAAVPANLGHATVYLPGRDHAALVSHFARMGVETHLFSAGTPGRRGCVWSRPLEMLSFQESMSTCDLVVTAGGFETPAEALAMGKRLIVVPIGGHYEQACNAEALSRMGVRVCRDLASLRDLSCDLVDYVWDDPVDEILSDLGF